MDRDFALKLGAKYQTRLIPALTLLIIGRKSEAIIPVIAQ